MVEFDGKLSGKAKKRFIWRQRKTGIIGSAIVFPIIFVVLSIMVDDPLFTYICLGGIILMFLLLNFRPFGKRELEELLPKRIYANKTYIVCVAEKYKESQCICDVSKILDYGEYYEIRFFFGKISDKFICQKDLLTKGSLEEFERIFEGKIKRCISR